MSEKTYDEAKSIARSAERAAAPFLFLVIEGGRPSAGGARFALDQIDEVCIGRGNARAIRRAIADGVRCLNVTIADTRMSTSHVRITRTSNRFVVEDRGSTNGTRVNGVKLEKPLLLVDGDVVDAGRAFFVFRTLDASASDLSLDGSCSSLATLLPGLASELESIDRIAPSPVSVLLTGETGTGKEVVARALHDRSQRRGAFIAVNCGALPIGLVEAQLFGHARGAFSGALRDEDGFVRAADGGTLFLDEIGDLPPSSQASLLRVLQEHEVVPVGATRPIRVDLRVVAATHRDLRTMVDGDRFRGDLYARIAAFTFALTPLRERIEDVGVLVARVIAATGRGADMTFASETCRALLAYDWPLNIRELKQCVEVAGVLSRNNVVQLANLPAEIVEPRRTQRPVVPRGSVEDEEDRLHRSLVAELTRTRGNIAEVARTFGKARMQVQRWMKRYNLDPKSFR